VRGVFVELGHASGLCFILGVEVLGHCTDVGGSWVVAWLVAWSAFGVVESSLPFLPSCVVLGSLSKRLRRVE
jgi:hypothetical protein